MAGERPRIEEYLAEVPEYLRPRLIITLREIESELLRQAGEQPGPEGFQPRLEETDTVFPGPDATRGFETPIGEDRVRAIAPGMVLLDKYLVGEKLGEGGMGSVSRVRLLGSGENAL